MMSDKPLACVRCKGTPPRVYTSESVVRHSESITTYRSVHCADCFATLISEYMNQQPEALSGWLRYVSKVSSDMRVSKV